AARGKQYLVMLRPLAGGLVMQQLMYADEVRPFSEVPVGEGEVRENELKLAIQLIDQISSDEFRPEVYEDDVRKRTSELIQRKVEGEDISIEPPEAPRAQIIDLMDALKASLANKPEAPSKASRAAEPDAEDRKPARRAPRASAERTRAGRK